MKDRLLHLAGEDKKKLLFLAALSLAAVFLLLAGNTAARDDANADAVSAAAGESFDTEGARRDLEEVLSRVDGVGSVAVVITWSDEGEELYAYNEETVERGGEEGATEKTTRSELVSAGRDDEPVLKNRLRPKIDGVLIVAEGAADDRVRARLQAAAATCLDVGANRVEVTAAR